MKNLIILILFFLTFTVSAGNLGSPGANQAESFVAVAQVSEVDGWIDLGPIELQSYSIGTLYGRLYGIYFGSKYLYKILYDDGYYNVEQVEDPSNGQNAKAKILVMVEKRKYSGMNDGNGHGIMKNVVEREFKTVFFSVPQW